MNNAKRKALKEQPDAVIECRDNLDFMAEFQDGAFKLIVTSPPYNLWQILRAQGVSPRLLGYAIRSDCRVRTLVGRTGIDLLASRQLRLER